jgi:hypothetical protein
MDEPTNPHSTNDHQRPAHSFVVVGLLLALIASNVGWYILYQNQAAQPKAKVTASPSPAATASDLPLKQGIIKGSIGYPSEHAPAQTICAVSTTNAADVTCVEHAGGNSLSYSLAVAPGTYYVYASLKAAQGEVTPNYKAYYNKFVTCGLAASCAAATHTQYVSVVVAEGATVTGINPTDWYAL